MVDLATYYNSAINFINSLVIKIDEIRIQQNYHLYVKYGKTAPEPTHSKYYQNITGTKNIVDPVVYIKVLEGSDIIELTPTLLNENSHIKNELMKFDKYYTETLNLNPGMSDYIKGLLYNLNLIDCIEKPNYTILAYGTNFIESNEVGLIADIESFISKFMVNYNNKHYMVDELYISSLLGLLYTNLFNYILSLKMKNILTFKADTFHRNLHLMSYKYLANDTDVVDLSTNIWLYGNINRMKHNIGKNHILENVLVDVFNRNHIGIGEAIFKRNNLEYLDGNYEDVKKGYVNEDTNLVIYKANNAAYNVVGEVYNIDRVNELFVDNDQVPKYKTINSKYYQELLKTNYLSNSLSKMFLLDKPNKVRLVDESKFNIVISNIISLINNKNLSHLVNYHNPIDSKLYKLTPDQVKLMLVYILYKLNDLTEDKFSIKYGGMLNTNIDTNATLLTTWYKLKNTNVLKYLLRDTVSPNSIVDKNTLTEYINSVINVEEKIWFTICNSIDNTLKNDIKTMSNSIFSSFIEEYDINVLQSKIENYGFDSFLNKFTYKIVLESLMSAAVDIETDSLKSLLNRYKKIINIFDKNTSYTVQLLLNINFSDTYTVNANRNNMNLAYKSYLEIKDAEYKIYEEANYSITSTTENTNNDMDVKNITNLVSSKPSGYMPIMTAYDSVKTGFYLFGNIDKVYPMYKPELGKETLIDNNELTISDTNITNYIKDPYFKLNSKDIGSIATKPSLLSVPSETYSDLYAPNADFDSMPDDTVSVNDTNIVNHNNSPHLELNSSNVNDIATEPSVSSIPDKAYSNLYAPDSKLELVSDNAISANDANITNYTKDPYLELNSKDIGSIATKPNLLSTPDKAYSDLYAPNADFDSMPDDTVSVNDTNIVNHNNSPHLELNSNNVNDIATEPSVLSIPDKVHSDIYTPNAKSELVSDNAINSNNSNITNYTKDPYLELNSKDIGGIATKPSLLSTPDKAYSDIYAPNADFDSMPDDTVSSTDTNITEYSKKPYLGVNSENIDSLATEPNVLSVPDEAHSDLYAPDSKSESTSDETIRNKDNNATITNTHKSSKTNTLVEDVNEVVLDIVVTSTTK